jgi:hypothetical protein
MHQAPRQGEAEIQTKRPMWLARNAIARNLMCVCAGDSLCAPATWIASATHVSTTLPLNVHCAENGTNRAPAIQVRAGSDDVKCRPGGKSISVVTASTAICAVVVLNAADAVRQYVRAELVHGCCVRKPWRPQVSAPFHSRLIAALWCNRQYPPECILH